jgi:hypothetical protein
VATLRQAWQAGDRRAQLRGLFYRSWHRLHNRISDGVAVLAGACNRSTWDGRGYSAGYAHWRCMLGRGHAGPHRFHNYVWDGPGSRARFDPLPVDRHRGHRCDLPFRHVTRRRYMTDSRARQRIRRRVAEEALAARRRGD